MTFVDLQKAAITGTVFNPRQFEQRFKALNHLLSFYDLQDKVHQKLQLINSTAENRESETLTLHEDHLVLTSMDVFLERMIMDSCSYVSIIVFIQ